MARLLAVSSDKTVATLSLDTMDVVGQLELPDLVSRVCFSPAMDFLAASCDDCSVYVIRVDGMAIEGALIGDRYGTCVCCLQVFDINYLLTNTLI